MLFVYLHYIQIFLLCFSSFSLSFLLLFSVHVFIIQFVCIYFVWCLTVLALALVSPLVVAMCGASMKIVHTDQILERLQTFNSVYTAWKINWTYIHSCYKWKKKKNRERKREEWKNGKEFVSYVPFTHIHIHSVSIAANMHYLHDTP